MTSFSLTISTVWLGIELPRADPLDVRGNADDPVRIVPDEVGLDQVMGDPLGLVVVAAGGGEDVVDQLLECRVVDVHGKSPGP